MDTTATVVPPTPTVAAPVLTQSPTIGALAAALAAAQGTFEAASKDRNNPFFGSRYATLSSVWDAGRAGLSKNGLAVIQQVARAGAEVSVRTVLAHSSGEWMASVITLPVLPMQKKDGSEMKITAQSYGSAITYGRRYGLAAIVGIAPDDDDDGNQASSRDHAPTNGSSPGAAAAHAEATKAARARDAKAKKPEGQQTTAGPKLVEAPGRPNLDVPVMVFGKGKNIVGKELAKLTADELAWAMENGRLWIHDKANEKNAALAAMKVNFEQLIVEHAERSGLLSTKPPKGEPHVEKDESQLTEGERLAREPGAEG